MKMTALKEAVLCAETLQVASIMEFHPARPARHFSNEQFRVRSCGLSSGMGGILYVLYGRQYRLLLSSGKQLRDKQAPEEGMPGLQVNVM
jgi:hypothetical protein